MKGSNAGFAFAALFVLGAAAVAAQSGTTLGAAWRHWQFSAAVSAPPTSAPLWAVKIPPRVSGKAQRDWGDLRVLDAAGAEVPYVLRARHERRSTRLREARLYDVSFKHGDSTQGIVDLGAAPQEHNSLVLLVGESEYFTHVALAISNDARDWRQIRDRVPIYRFASERLDGNQTVNYPVSRARYLRVRILQTEKPFALTGVRVEQDTVEAAELLPLDVFFRRDTAAPEQQTWWSADIGPGHDPVSQVRFTVEQPEFHRAVRISTSARPTDARSWIAVGEGEIYRYRRGPELYEKLAIGLPETRAQFWRVEIFNRNDRELAGLKLTMLGTPRRIVFAANSGGAYRVAYGNPAARFATYEMARLTEAAALDAAAEASLGPEESNPGYTDPNPKPWSERNPVVLWGALLVAVLVLGSLALRAMRPS